MSELWLPPGTERAPREPAKKLTHRVDGTPIAQSEDRGDFGSDEEVVETLPSEEEEMGKIMMKYMRMTGSMSSDYGLSQMKDDIIADFASLGFIVKVGFAEVGHVSGQMAYSPVVTPVGRIGEGFDNDRMSWEVQHGLADGVAGVTTFDGKLKDPKKVFGLS